MSGRHSLKNDLFFLVREFKGIGVAGYDKGLVTESGNFIEGIVNTFLCNF